MTQEGSTYAPMLAQPIEITDVERKCSGYWIEPKLDGWRCFVVLSGKNGLELLTRTGHHMEGKIPSYLRETLEDLPDGCILDGELGFVTPETSDAFWPIFDYNLTARVLGSLPSTAQEKLSNLTTSQNDPVMEFIPFDLLRWPFESLHGGGADLTVLSLDDRTNWLCKLISRGDIQARCIIDSEHVVGSGWQSYEEAYELYVDEGGEGVMLKNPKAPYQSGKRPSKTWYKLKKYETQDVVIIGYEEGQGKYEGQVGAVNFGVVSLPLSDVSKGMYTYKPIGKCSGMTDEVRLDMTAYFSTKYLHRVMEIKHFGKVGRHGAGGLRHPQFVRLRFDKEPQECT